MAVARNTQGIFVLLNGNKLTIFCVKILLIFDAGHLLMNDIQIYAQNSLLPSH